jgi:putative ABC transport system ATP-binding protein
MTCLIETRDLVKKYRVGQEVITALDNVNIQIDPGEFICVLGASGSGKSTLLHTVAGLDRPTRGDIVVKGTSIVKMKEKDMALFRRRYMGFVFQSYNLIPTLTALENVSMPLMFDGVRRRERYKKAREILTQIGLKDRMKNKPTEMSGGQQQRVSIARALINDPKILYADEPTGNLDTKTTKEIMEILQQKVRGDGVTLMMVTHNLELAEYADRVIHMKDGRVMKIDGKNRGEIGESAE